MPEVNEGRRLASTPLAARPARPVANQTPTVATPRPAMNVDSARLQTRTTAALPAGAWVPKEPKDELVGPPRGLWAFIADALKRMSDAMADGGADPEPKAPPAPSFNPATAEVFPNGSQQAPDGRPIVGAPRPGAGPVSPPGLVQGNTVLRYGPAGATNMVILDQNATGSTNGCGTTSLAMILNYHAGNQAFDRSRVDRAIRHYDMFTSPGDVAAFAERQGLQAAMRTGTTPDELRAMLDQGLPVQILIDVAAEHDGTGLHYEVVTGYGKAPNGERFFELANPSGRREYMAETTLLARWSNLTVQGIPTAIDRVAIAMKPPASNARLFGDMRHAVNASQSVLRPVQGLTEVTVGWARSEPDTVIAGVVRLVPGGLAAVPAVVGNTVRVASQDVAVAGWNNVGTGVGNTLLGVGQMGVGAAGVVIAAPVEFVGNVASVTVNATASGIKSVGGWIRSWF